jgi:hypothetical protein
MKRGSAASTRIELWSGLESVDMPPPVKAGCGACFAGIGVINNLAQQFGQGEGGHAGVHEVLLYGGMKTWTQADQGSSAVWRI